MPRRPHPLRSRPVRVARALGLAVLALLLGAGCGATDDGATDRFAAPPPAVERLRPPVATAPGFLRPVEERPGPARLRIPSISVDVRVVPVGVDAAGDMEVPGAEIAGWYRFGPRPGENGSAVLAAHVDYDGRPGAFYRLDDVAPGDLVEVTDAEGAVQTLTVRDVTRLPKAALAGRGTFDRTGRPRVALVTCGGDFDPVRRSYEDNVLVLAEPREQP
jgi:hypothetical protein